MTEEDVARYIELEVADIGMVENAVSEVVCYRPGCGERIAVDPATLVIEDDDAVETVTNVPADAADPLGPTDRKQVEIYCSPECRNERYGGKST